MFLMRNARRSDLGDLHKLSYELKSMNLPSQKADLSRMITRSEQSFKRFWGRNKEHAQYVFVMEDTDTGKVIGSSKIFARHGTEKKPHLYFQVIEEKVRSKTLNLEFDRKSYRFKSDTRGCTEVGGLILSPRYRGHPDQLGKQLSYIRFLFMKVRPGSFMKKVIAELLPPLRDGRSSLWEFYGKKLTRLAYHKADLLSYKNKEFVMRLFPRADLIHDVLPAEVQADMGQTGAESTAARALLSKIGFRYAHQVDPFDGGPHYTAVRDQIQIYRQAKQLRFGGILKYPTKQRRMILVERGAEIRCLTAVSQIRHGYIYIQPEAAELLKLRREQVVFAYLMRT